MRFCCNRNRRHKRDDGSVTTEHEARRRRIRTLLGSIGRVYEDVAVELDFERVMGMDGGKRKRSPYFYFETGFAAHDSIASRSRLISITVLLSLQSLLPPVVM